ncbi:MAG: hypothetical protein Kow0068_08070 [Marinilabiliales bacterium]
MRLLLSFLKILFILAITNGYGQYNTIKENKDLILQLMKTKPELFDNLIENSKKYRLQIIYTRVITNPDGTKSLQDYYYRLNPDEYVYLASVIKLPMAALTLEKLNELKVFGIDRFTSFQMDTNITCDDKPIYNTFIQKKLKNLDMCIRKALVLSDNDAYNVMFDFLDSKWINLRLQDMGYDNIRVLTRFIRCNKYENRMSAGMKFFINNKIVYEKAEHYNILDFSYKHPIYIGKKHVDNDVLIDKPKDFSNYNFISLLDAHTILKSLVYPELFNDKQKFNLTQDELNYLLNYLSIYPKEMNDYSEEYISQMPDNYMNFILIGQTKKVENQHLKVYNKSGMSFGFVSDVAYIKDTEKNIEFFLSAVIYTNKNEIINDDHYEYAEVAIPFMVSIGKLIYDYELFKKNENEKNN